MSNKKNRFRTYTERKNEPKNRRKEIIIKLLIGLPLVVGIYYFYRLLYLFVMKDYLYGRPTGYLVTTLLALASISIIVACLPCKKQEWVRQKKKIRILAVYLVIILLIPLLFVTRGSLLIDENQIYINRIFTQKVYDYNYIKTIDFCVYEVKGLFYYVIKLEDNTELTLWGYEYIYPSFKNSHSVVKFHKRAMSYINQESIDKQDYKILSRRFFDNDEDFNYLREYLKQVSQGKNVE